MRLPSDRLSSALGIRSGRTSGISLTIPDPPPTRFAEWRSRDGAEDSRFLNIDGAAGSRGNVVAHNTNLQAADARWAINIEDASTGATVVNNIVLNAHPYRGSISVSADSLPGVVSDQRATGQDLHSLVAGVTDDGSAVAETDEANHCTASARTVTVTR
jgi:hypothetical protein